MVGGLGGISVGDLVDKPSHSLFASSYEFWQTIGATMLDIAIGCGALIAFGFVLFLFLGCATLGYELLRSFVEWVREQR